MTRRTLSLFALSMVMVMAGASASSANLKRYDMKLKILLHYTQTSPRANFNTANLPGTATIDNDFGSGTPIMRSLILGGISSPMTTDVPGLSGFIFFNQKAIQGPDDNQAGSGDVLTTIAWGDMSGWSITGGTWCHSVPSTICDLAVAQDNTTVPPDNLSSHYDLGSWFFHGTGFTATPYINRTAPTNPGNLQYYLRGASQQGTVPALPLLGIGAVGVSVVAMGIATIRRRNKA